MSLVIEDFASIYRPLSFVLWKKSYTSKIIGFLYNDNSPVRPLLKAHIAASSVRLSLNFVEIILLI